MTEIERILSKSVLPSHFLKEEIRDDFLVDSHRKKIWAISLDLLFEFDRVCKKHNLTYFLFFGSLLGAIRHKGFIPWDDDLDLCMFRSDYKKLLTLKDEFSNPYFLQTPYTDPNCFRSFTKIRNSNTTGIASAFRYQNYNQGMWIDIFPLDIVNPSLGKEAFEQIKNLNIDNSTFMKKSNPNPLEKDLERIAKYDEKNPLERYEKVQELASQYNEDEDFVATMTMTVYPYEKSLFKKSDFSETLLVPYEGFLLPIPIGYENILRTNYGNYHEFPPLEKRGVWHDTELDPETPYKKYLLEKFGIKQD